MNERKINRPKLYYIYKQTVNRVAKQNTLSSSPLWYYVILYNNILYVKDQKKKERKKKCPWDDGDGIMKPSDGLGPGH